MAGVQGLTVQVDWNGNTAFDRWQTRQLTDCYPEVKESEDGLFMFVQPTIHSPVFENEQAAEALL